MRILHLLNHTRRLNGHVHAALDLASEQVKQGHKVAIASAGGDFDSLLTRAGVDIFTIDHTRKPLALLKSGLALHRVLKNWRADVVHAHMVTSAVLAWPVCKALSLPLVTTTHNEFDSGVILMGLGDRVIAVSGAVGQSLVRRGMPQRKVAVVLNGTIGAVRFDGKDRRALELSRPAVIFVGGLHPRKGIADLFAAFERVHASHPKASLFIVGGGPSSESYIEQARALTCADAIHFAGPQDNPYPYMAGADIFVLPSHADPAPLVMSEAREAGCAIIATNVDGIPELLEHGDAGILVPPRDPERLAHAISSLLSDADALKVWKQKSQINIQHLHIERVARQTLDVYKAARTDRRLGEP